MKNDINTDHYKEVLLKEKAELEEDLSHLGRVNPKNENDWEAVKGDLHVMQSDLNELADEFEDFEEDMSVLSELEGRLNQVKHALRKIKGEKEVGEYGICEVTGKPIPEERLEINPAARSHVDHIDELEPLYPNTDD
jgi:RNA polymerase-binding transcription factor DksA